MNPNAPSLKQGREAAGQARLEVELVYRESTVTTAYSTSPMKLLTPRARGTSVWAYTSSFGGGLVAGDQTRLEVTVGPGARCFLGTQASTKVYRNPSQLPSGHTTCGSVARDALLVFAPDAIQAFRGSVYSQQQEFHLAAGANLALLDWFSAGRTQRGERWEFARFSSRNDIYVDGARVFLDSISLDASESSPGDQHRCGRFNCFATLVLLGPLLQAAARRVLDATAASPIAPRATLITSASPVDGGAVLRLAGESLESVHLELQRHLHPTSEWLGDNPWTRKS